MPTPLPTLYDLRCRRFESQEACARAMGMHRNTYWGIEVGRRTPTPRTFWRLAMALKVPHAVLEDVLAQGEPPHEAVV